MENNDLKLDLFFMITVIVGLVQLLTCDIAGNFFLKLLRKELPKVIKDEINDAIKNNCNIHHPQPRNINSKSEASI